MIRSIPVTPQRYDVPLRSGSVPPSVDRRPHPSTGTRLPGRTLMVRDPLTGVYGKTALAERLEEEVHRGLRYGEIFSLLLVDLDHFKSINDAFGHARGDGVLAEFVARVQATARGSDVLFRYGGDEFVLLLPHTSHEHATRLASRLLDEVRSAPFPGSPPLTLSISVGVAAFPEDGDTADALFERADARMYEAKRGGRARVVATDPADAAALLFDDGRLVERVDAVERASRFLEALPRERRGVLRITGPAGVGRSRMLREVESLARLRGFRLLAIRGRPGLREEPLAALRAAWPEASGSGLGPGETTELAALLRSGASRGRDSALVLTVDEPSEIDRPTLDVVRALLAGPRRGPAVGLVCAAGEGETERIAPDPPLRAVVELLPLTREGVRVWLRQVLRWEPPGELVERLHEHAGGRPKEVRAALLQLVERRVLVHRAEGWGLAEGTGEIPFLPGGALRARSRSVRGIPAVPGPLVGRDAELRQLLRLLRATHLLTLCGPGGAGKTRLAVEAATEAQEIFPDGVVFLSLADAAPPPVLAAALAHALEVGRTEGPDPLVPVLRYLHPRRLLLVLDGCEHAGDGPALVARILETAPGVCVLATARDRLRLPGEWVFQVDGLRVPRWADADRMAAYGAVQLFTERAAALDPAFSLRDSDALSVLRICQVVDGNPLGVEIAAAQVSALACRDIAHELESSLDAINTYLPAATPEQRRFRALLEQTWRLFPASVRSTLRRCSLFRGDFDEGAAARVAGTDAALLAELVGRAVVHPVSPGRYALHPMLREYASDKLDEFPGERERAASAFAEHYLDLLERWTPALRTASGAGQALCVLLPELPHLRRAWQLALARGREDRVERVERAAEGVFLLCAAREAWAEGEWLFARALEWLEGPGDGWPEASAALGRVLARHAACALRLRRNAAAREGLERALAVAQALGDASEESFARRHLGLALRAAGDAAAARAQTDGAMAAARVAADPHEDFAVLQATAVCAAADGALDAAAGLLLEAVGTGVDSRGLPAVWEMLVAVAGRLARADKVPLAVAVLSFVVAERAAGHETLAKAERLLNELREAGAPAPAKQEVVLVEPERSAHPIPLTLLDLALPAAEAAPATAGAGATNR